MPQAVGPKKEDTSWYDITKKFPLDELVELHIKFFRWLWLRSTTGEEHCAEGVNRNVE